MTTATYTGPVVFVEGVHYACNDDGHADLTKPLRWEAAGYYRDALDGEPLHNDANHENELELEPGSED